MAVMMVYFDILIDDPIASKLIHTQFVDELRRGRRENQIFFEENICFISTPEDIFALARRLSSTGKLRIDKDGLAIIDKKSKKIYVWGVCNMEILERFPKYKIIIASQKMLVEI
jgi:hypothetical protein